MTMKNKKKITCFVLAFCVCFLFYSGCKNTPEEIEDEVDEIDDFPYATDIAQTPWTGTTPFPFDMPSKETLQASAKKVFAHYMPGTTIISIDNREAHEDYWQHHYLSPDGEGGQYAQFGGFVRNRPLPRPPRPESNWKELDFEVEVRNAIAIGLDGFAVDLLGTWNTSVLHTNMLLDAAQRVDPGGFKILLMPDMAVFRENFSSLAPYIKQLSAHPAVLRTDDGRLIVAPYGANMIRPQGTTAVAW